jgi:hypothetical protein
VSNVWETRCRLLLERLEALANQLGNEEPKIAPMVLEEYTVRLLAGVVMLLRQHRVNRRGQCRYCGWTMRTWRLWHSRPQCTVYLVLDFAMGQPLDLIWRLLLADRNARSQPVRGAGLPEGGIQTILGDPDGERPG